MSSRNFDFDGTYKQMTAKLNENGYPLNPMLINRGGQNRYNYGFEYKICGLSTNLSQKGNDKEKMKEWREEFKDKLYISKYVEGTSVITKEDVRGRICSFTYTDESALKLKYVWVFNEDTMKKEALIPSTVHIVKTDYHKEWRNRMNPFSTNMGHLREKIEDDDINKISRIEYDKRCQLITMTNLSEEAINYFDDKFINGIYESNELNVDNVFTNLMLNAIGLKYTVKDKSRIRESLKKLTTLYCHMTERDMKPLSIKCDMTMTSFKSKDGGKNDFVICSWIELFFIFDALMIIRSNNNINTLDPSVGRFLSELVPYKDKLKNGKTVFINR